MISPAGLPVLTSPGKSSLVNHRQRIITGVGLAAGLVAGGGAGLILEGSGSAGAAAGSAVATDPSSTSPPPTTTPSTGSSGTTATPSTAPAGTSAKTDRGDRLKQLLQSLVDDGTLTQAQVDAVIAKLDTAGPVARGGGPGFGDPGFGGRRGAARVSLQTVATTLGVTVDDVQTALRDGQTIAAYAVTKGKTAQDVIDALVAEAKTALDAQVKAGTLTQAQEDTRMTTATTEITDVVNNGTPNGGPGIFGGEHGRGPGGGRDGGHGAPDGSTKPSGSAPSPSTTTPSTTVPATTG